MASVLPARCERDPVSAAELARQLSADARQAAVEARALMTDLRPTADPDLPLARLIGTRARLRREIRRDGALCPSGDDGAVHRRRPSTSSCAFSARR